MLKALIFDVDGTLAETEELHRQCFNACFAAARLDWNWDRQLYGQLLTTTGGAERIKRFISDKGLRPKSDDDIRQLHHAKNNIYATRVAEGSLELRPGVARLIESAKQRGLKLGIATTTSRSNLGALLTSCFANPSAGIFDVTICGEDVLRKKPDPEAYVHCLKALGVDRRRAIAFEDSGAGLAAATAAGLLTIVTPSAYCLNDDFTGARMVVADLSDNALLDKLFTMLP